MEILDWLKNQKTAECQIAHDEIALLRVQLSKPQPTSQEVLDADYNYRMALKGRMLLTEWLRASSEFDLERWELKVRNFIEDEGKQNE